MTTEEQQCIFEWLDENLQLPVFSNAYKGAVQLLKEKPPGHITYIAHFGRDVMNILARTVANIVAKRVQYKDHLDSLQDEWNESWGSSGFSLTDDSPTGHLVPFKTCQMINDLIYEHKAGRLRSSDADSLFFSTFLDYPDRGSIPQNFLKDWKKAKAWFLSHAHLRKEEFRKCASTEAISHFCVLENLLLVAAQSSFERINKIDEILEETNG